MIWLSALSKSWVLITDQPTGLSLAFPEQPTLVNTTSVAIVNGVPDLDRLGRPKREYFTPLGAGAQMSFDITDIVGGKAAPATEDVYIDLSIRSVAANTAEDAEVTHSYPVSADGYDGFEGRLVFRQKDIGQVAFARNMVCRGRAGASCMVLIAVVGALELEGQISHVFRHACDSFGRQ